MSYVDLIKTTALQQNVPVPIAIAVAQQESNIRQFDASGQVLKRYESHLNEYSRGIFQLLGSTARDMGVNPDDPVQNIQGGVKYLKLMRNLTDSWQSALEAYNGGIGNWQRGTTTDDAKRYAVQVLGRAGMPLDKPGGAGTGPTRYVPSFPSMPFPTPYAVDPMGGPPPTGQGFEVTQYNAPNTFTWPPVAGTSENGGNKEMYLAAAALLAGLLIVLIS